MTMSTSMIATVPPARRWGQLALGVVAMMAVSSPQYTWPLFTGPLTKTFGVSLAELQWTFSLLVILQTFVSPVQAWLVERFGPRLLVSAGALLSGASWVFASRAGSVAALYLTYGVMGGIGTGIVYIGVVGLMVRWFPDRRGLAAGLAAAGYGAGAIFTSIPIANAIRTDGYAHTLLVWGLVQGGIGLIAALGLSRPEASAAEHAALPGRNPAEMLSSPIFYLMFLMMALMSTGGLMVVSNIGAFAKYYHVAGTIVFGIAAALPLSLTLSRATNGLTRPFFGWVSDRIGRELTMALAFSLEAVAVATMFAFIDQPVLFVLLTGLVFFGWGEIFSLFPATLTDTFGPRHATTNYGFLYIAQGVGSVLGGPVAAALEHATGSWSTVFLVVIALDLLTAFLAIAVLRPLRVRKKDKVLRRAAA